MSSKIQGLIAAPFTPLQSDGSLHLDAVQGYANVLARNGVIGAFVCGTTGEGLSLTTSERCQLAERWVQVAPTGLRVIVHVGHTSLKEACQLAAHAQSVGASSIACMAPCFFKPAGVEGLIEWCQQVAQAAPDLAFYYYHIPSMTGFTDRVGDFLEHVGTRIPNLVGVKFTYEDLDDFGRCLRFAGGRYDMLFGRDELLLSALSLGCRGAVGSTYNFAAPLYLELIKAYDTGDQDRAAELQQLAVQMIQTLIQCSIHPIATFKSLMNRYVFDCGPARLPLVSPTPGQFSKLEKQLDALGVLQWLTKP
ncbi:MAG: dihydrodipicolinate synthase family protein [Planctomycetota bacterium]